MNHFFPSTTGGIELFDEFFESGLEESVSPFLSPNSRKLGKNIRLKSSWIAAFCMLCALISPLIFEKEAISNLFLLFTYFFAGIPALISTAEDILNLEININVLTTISAFLAIFIGSAREGAILLVLFSFSGAMEIAIKVKAKGALSALKKLAPQKAYVVKSDGSLAEQSIKDIKIGTHIHIKSGEVIPLDGKVISGSSSVNLSHLTGESLPVTCKEGDDVPAGGKNLEGALTIEVTHICSDSTLARIIQLIIQAQSARPKLQRWLDSVSNRYAITILSLTALLTFILPLFFSIPFFGKEGSIYRSLAFLIAASPCALVIAIPITYLSAISSCAKQGILLKGGIMLDALTKCTTIAMDKTGTLTTGDLVCLEMITDHPDKNKLLSIAYALERSTIHPIAKAITNYAEKEGIAPAKITEFKTIPGHGLECFYKKSLIRIGGPAWFTNLPDNIKEVIDRIMQKGEIVSIMLVDDIYAIFRFKDLIRPKIVPTLNRLKKKWNLRLVMLTGDHKASATAIAKEAGIDEFYSDLRPDDKLKYISNNPHLAMVGDGINDAPALARAAVGISMGRGGSKTAIDASDIVLLQDNIELMEWLFSKAHAVTRTVKQNVAIATGLIFLATIPALLGYLPLWMTVILHEGGTVLVGLNALKLLKGKSTTVDAL